MKLSVNVQKLTNRKFRKIRTGKTGKENID